MIVDSAKKLIRGALGRVSFAGEEELAYSRLAVKGFRPSGIVDVGAYQGNWTRIARRLFPDAPVLMIEAQECKRPHLEATCAELHDVTYVLAVLGPVTGEPVTFYEMETGSSMMSENSNVARTERHLVTRNLDEVAVGMPDPLFLKIDVQGAELQVLDGGARTLSRAEVVQLEVAMLPYNKARRPFLRP